MSDTSQQPPELTPEAEDAGHDPTLASDSTGADEGVVEENAPEPGA